MKSGFRAVLICTGGKTEKNYFSILCEVFRLTPVATVEILSEKGQSGTLFLTVQRLTEFLISLEPG